MITPERMKELEAIAEALTPLAILIGGVVGWFGMSWLDKRAEKRARKELERYWELRSRVQNRLTVDKKSG